MGQDYDNPFGLTAPKSGRTKKMSELLDSMVIPGVQGGPLMHVIAAKAVAFKEALEPGFADYGMQVIKNAQRLAVRLQSHGYHIVSGGTDNHLFLVDLRNKGLTGKDAQEALDRAGITVNKNGVPFDDKSPLITSGIRIGTPALTTRGMKEAEMDRVGDFIHEVLSVPASDAVASRVAADVERFCGGFPLYPELARG
jgi:glycine hydroxymethyltransferase